MKIWLQNQIKVNSVKICWIHFSRREFCEFSQVQIKLARPSWCSRCVCADGYLTVIGKTPQSADIQDLIAWKIKNDIFLWILLKFTHQQRNSKMSLVGCWRFPYPSFKRIIFLVPSWSTSNCEMGGDKVVEVEQDGSLLLPRKSFELWQETVRLTSLPQQCCARLLNWQNQRRVRTQQQRTGCLAYIASHDLKEPPRDSQLLKLPDWRLRWCAQRRGSLETANHDAFDPADGRLDWVPTAFFLVWDGWTSMQKTNLNEVENVMTY